MQIAGDNESLGQTLPLLFIKLKIGAARKTFNITIPFAFRFSIGISANCNLSYEIFYIVGEGDACQPRK